jgi:hypothetical protein
VEYNCFHITWDDKGLTNPYTYSYSELVRRVENGRYLVVSQPDIPLNVALANIGSERSMAMSHNIGRMEGTIEILFDRITRMRGSADLHGHLEVMADCESMRETIIRCAQALTDLPSVDGGSKPSDLKTYIKDQK